MIAPLPRREHTEPPVPTGNRSRGRTASRGLTRRVRPPAVARRGRARQAELALLVQLEAACTTADSLAEAVEEAFPQHRDADVILSFPGLGVQLGARVLAEIERGPAAVRRRPRIDRRQPRVTVRRMDRRAKAYPPACACMRSLHHVQNVCHLSGPTV